MRFLIFRAPEKTSAIAEAIHLCHLNADLKSNLSKNVLFCPLHTTRALSENKQIIALNQTIASLETFAAAVFVSPNAIHFGLTAILEKRALPPHLQLACLSRQSAETLQKILAKTPQNTLQNAAQKSAIAHIIYPKNGSDSESLLAEDFFSAAQIKGKKVLILRAEEGRQFFADSLEKRDASIQFLACYERIPNLEGEEKLVQFAKEKNACAPTLLFFSSTDVRRATNLLENAQVFLSWRNYRLISPFVRVLQIAQQSGWQNTLHAPNLLNESAQSMQQFFSK